MPTAKQELGLFGEKMVLKNCICPGCKRPKTLKQLIQNFKCADLICDFCGFLAQVKASNQKNIDRLPKTLPAAAWGPQRDRMQAAIYFPLFIVLVNKGKFTIHYLSADLQVPEMFIPRKPLSEKAKRAGWQGFEYDLTKVSAGAIVKVFDSDKSAI